MRYWILSLTFFPVVAIAQPYDMTWSIKGHAQGEGRAEFDKKILNQEFDPSKLRGQFEDHAQTVLSHISETLTHIAQGDDLALITQLSSSSAQLLQLVRETTKKLPGVATSASLVLSPAQKRFLNDAEENKAFDEKAFLSGVYRDMMYWEFLNYREVKEGGSQMYLLGATASVVLTRPQKYIHMQVVMGLNAQYIEGNPGTENTPVEITGPTSYGNAPIMIVDIWQGLNNELPKVDFSFGKLGPLVKEKDGRYHYEIRKRDALCGRAEAVPHIIKRMGVTFSLPLYSARMDLNTMKVTDADLRLSSSMCVDPLQLREKFISHANEKLGAVGGALRQLIGASPEEFKDYVVREREKAGLN